MGSPLSMLESEAVALLVRLEHVQPFSLSETMVPAAALHPRALCRLEYFLHHGQARLRRRIKRYLSWLRSDAGEADAARAQRAFVVLRLEFNTLLSQFDLFADVVTQRSEHGTGVWLAGLDVAAADGLRTGTVAPGVRERLPEVACYLDRGPGAAIRRARTRLPGGAENPVAIVRVPRERMIGSGVASSLMHEVGHQGDALLGLRDSVAGEVALHAADAPARDRAVWRLWERWLGEIIPDLWAVASVGVCSTLGLIQVVSLPRAFVFRWGTDDPHPPPWIRVLLSAAVGARLYPHPQWERLRRTWVELYPLGSGRREEFARLAATIPELVELLAGHRSSALGPRTLAQAMALTDRTPQRLAAIAERWRRDPRTAALLSPSLAFAVVGQAKADGTVGPRDEGRLVEGLLRSWAFGRALGRERAAADPAVPACPARHVRCSIPDRG
ncbi:hypothetical protein GCM10007079_18280 [Nocardiopsis terrae]|uniref:HEXXH motif-containing protein n=1 Tax=Nocardiopsis terrae TaxID=372655 RepID=A0ABR9HHN8_9ACTN|nr:hypothetical protein [Nocardiopsis terrae]MBE1458547.1 hypothetical protein [Nocardiopsis terrae]GHC79826.1 hypothetical protein GCM10007079_18280 [Nocardiopsis terrae]